MNKKRVTLVFMLLIILLIVTYGTVSAADAGGISGLFPSMDTLSVKSSVVQKFNKYSLFNYIFDTNKFGIFDLWAKPVLAIVDFLFLIIVFISYVTIYLLMACFKLNIFHLISSGFNNMIWALRDTVFMQFVGPIFSIVGLVILFNVVVGKFQTAWRIIFSTLTVLIIAFFFFKQPSLVVDMVNEASQSISSSILQKTSGVVTGSTLSADDAVINLGNTLWDSTVTKPWQLIEFGKVTNDEAQMQKLIKNSISSKERKDLAISIGKDIEPFSPDGQVIRLVIAFFIGLVSLALDVLILILAVLTVIMQFAAVISAVIGVIAFTLALLPNMGLSVAVHSLYNTFGFLLAKIGMTILLAVYFAMSTAIYLMSDQYGWFFTSIMQVVVIATVILYRKQIMGFATSVTGGQQKAIDNIYQKRDTFKDLTRVAFTGYGLKKVYDGVQNMRERRADKKLGEKYDPVAKEYLEQRYTNEKRSAEAKASKDSAREGREVEPEYSDFIKQVDGRVDKGFTPFDEREIEKTVGMMKRLHKSGNNPNNLLTTNIDGVSDSKIRSKQIDMENAIEQERDNMENRRLSNGNKIEKNVRGNRDSKYYNFKTAIGVKARGVAEKVIDKSGLVEPLGNLNLSSNNISVLDELDNRIAEKEYQQMKKEEAAAMSEDRFSIIKEPEVVNGGTTGFRPTGSRPVGSEGKKNQDAVTRTADIMNRIRDDEGGNISSTLSGAETSGITTGNREYVGLEHEGSGNTGNNSSNRDAMAGDMANKVYRNSDNSVETNRKDTINTNNENKNNKELVENVANRRVDNAEKINNINNKSEEVNRANKNIENAAELNRRDIVNTNNENKNVKESMENVTNRNVDNVESVSNVTNKTEEVNKVNKDIENVAETNRKDTTNTSNEHKNVKESMENVTNRNVDNVESVNNVTNKTEEVNKVNKNIENVTETNKQDTINTSNEHKNIKESDELIINKDIENVNNTNNITNKTEDITSNGSIVENLREVNKSADIDKSDKRRNRFDKLQKLLKGKDNS